MKACVSKRSRFPGTLSAELPHAGRDGNIAGAEGKQARCRKALQKYYPTVYGLVSAQQASCRWHGTRTRPGA